MTGRLRTALVVAIAALGLGLVPDTSRPPAAAQERVEAYTAADAASERALGMAPMPPRDLFDLHGRLRGLDVPALREYRNRSTREWRIGSVVRFSVGNPEEGRYDPRDLVLRLVSPSAHWLVESGASYDPAALQLRADRFEGTVRRNRAAFGAEWSPGIDGDPRIVVAIASLAGVGGYFSSADEYPRALNPYSNEHEVIFVHAGTLEANPEHLDATLAHEHQHMIHWRRNNGQEVWLNEGLSEYATELNDVPPGTDTVGTFAQNPDTQLTTWGQGPGESRAHYGQAYRFVSYLARRFGAAFTRSLLEPGARGLATVEQALRLHAPGVTLRRAYADWLVANLLADEGRGALGYPPGALGVTTEPSPGERPSRATVRPWGADYYARPDNTAFTLRFRADPAVALHGGGVRRGRYAWYSNRGDQGASSLTREVDLSRVRAATLELDLWYEIEPDYDYLYVQVSGDGGASWRALSSPRTTDTNPNGNNLGNGITGSSRGWVTERFDLSAYAGRRALLRLEYVTDDGYNAEGVVLDGMRVPQTGFAEDAETGAGWRSAGWVRTNGRVPGRYRLLVTDPDGGGSYVEIPVGADGRANAVVPAGEGRPPAIIVSGVSETTTRPSAYELSIEPAAPGALGVIGGRAAPALP